MDFFSHALDYFQKALRIVESHFVSVDVYHDDIILDAEKVFQSMLCSGQSFDDVCSFCVKRCQILRDGPSSKPVDTRAPILQKWEDRLRDVESRRSEIEAKHAQMRRDRDGK